MENPISLKNIKKRFGDKPVLRQVSLQVAHGVIHGLIGPDGAGKTTLLRIAAGIMRQDSGVVSILRTAPGAGSRFYSLIGYMPQNYGLYLDLTVRENILFFAHMHSLPKQQAMRRAEELLDFVGLLSFIGRLVGKLSGGMYKKLALCTALIHDPDCLLLDEPTNGVDPVSRRDFWELIFQLSGLGKSILIATPYMDEAARCHKISVLDSGRRIYAGPPLADPGEKYTLISVRCQGKANPISILSAVPGVLEAYPVEDLFSVRVLRRRNPDTLKAAIKKALRIAGLQHVRFVKRQPRFEDVFLSMTAASGEN